MKSLVTILFSLFLLFSPFCSKAISEDSQTSKSIELAQGLSAAFENAAKVISPSVVNISAVKHAKPIKQKINPARRGQNPFQNPNQNPYEDFFGDDFFDKFFRHQMPPQGQGQGDQFQQGLGTGVIIDKEGHIVTNNHVVGDADEITVRIKGGKEYKAEIVGADPKTDLAVIKIKVPADLEPATLGDSDSLKIGEWVLAAGNPFGLDNTITAGIVSAKGRSNVGIVDYEDFIQTDAAINPGNSGGPLVNLRGEVVGINSAIFSKSGGYMGIGFSIPAKLVKNVMDSLLDNGRVIRGWLGVMIQNLDEDLSKSFNYEGTKGALVGDVTKDSPAAKGGLRQGDIVTALNGELIENVTHLRRMVAETKPGTKIELTVFRNGKTDKFGINITELANEMAQQTQENSENDIGIALRDITPEIAQQLGITKTKGVVVTNIEPGSVAFRAGIQPGDVILQFNEKEIETSQDFEKSLSSQDKSKGFRLTILNGEYKRYVFVKPLN